MYAREIKKYSNWLADTGLTWSVTPINLIGCLITCQSRGICVGLFYSQSTSTCYGYDTRMHDSTRTTNVPGMKYFESTGKHSGHTLY